MTLSKTGEKILHYIEKGIHDFSMIEKGDNILVCLSGGKDSFTLLTLLHYLHRHKKYDFNFRSYTLDQSQPGWDDTALRAWLEANNVPYEIETRNTYAIVKEKIPEGKTYCSLCSRLRRGNIYRYAKENGFNKIALGHHRDDLIRTFLMSILYAGKTTSMPPKLLTDSKQHIVIRPMVYVQETDIITFAKEQAYPIIPCTLCGSQENLARVRVKKLIDTLSAENPKIPSNILHAMQSICPSQLMDKSLWDFQHLAIEHREETNMDNEESLF